MKLFDIKNKVLFTLLIVGVTFNILWSMRLETRADKLGTLVDQYFDRLMALEDSFPVPLEKFSRTVKGPNPSKIEIANGGARIVSEDIELKTHVEGGGRFLLSSDPDIGLWFNVKSSLLNLNPEYINLRYAKSVGIESFAELSDEGLLLGSKQLIKLKIDDMKRILLDTEGFNFAFEGTQVLLDDKNFSITGPKTDGVDFRMSMDKGLIQTTKGNAVVRVGSGTHGEGVELGEFDTGTLAISKGKGVGISAKNSNPMKLHGENDLRVDFDGNIEIKAKGNINIRSETGQIKINGQEIHLNERSK